VYNVVLRFKTASLIIYLKMLNDIQHPSDLRNLNIEELNSLAVAL